ncbi:MAG: LruC domain-containing protein [Bacteroidota bacterium]|nr:LruC domain-containing protein [Bacteroidota bacterium]
MKKFILFSFISILMALILGVVSKVSAQNVSLTMESGAASIDAANCWGFQNVDYTNTSNELITGSYTARSAQFNGSVLSLSSPWVQNINGNITFKHRLTSSNQASNKVLHVISFDYNSNQYDTLYTYNSTTSNATTVVSASINTNKSGVFKVYFAFSGNTGSARGLLDDIVIPATYFSSPANGCVPSNAVSDSDGDGVPNNQDDYPNDAALAFNNYMNANFSTLMFEDLWPGKGDYDFNDLVVDYRINRITNANNKIVKAEAVVVLRAIGASYTNAFAFQINDLSPSKIT